MFKTVIIKRNKKRGQEMTALSTIFPGGSGGGDVSTDTIWDAKGDIVGGTGADTAAKLAVGTNGDVLIADSGETTGMKWADPSSSIYPIDWNNPVSITDTATLTIGKHHVVTVTSADKTLTLPEVSGNGGKLISVEIAATTDKLITLDGNTSEEIDGETTRVMWAKETAILLCNGTGWTKVAGKSISMISKMYASAVTQQSTAGIIITIAYDTSVISALNMSNIGSNRVDILRSGVYQCVSWKLFYMDNANQSLRDMFAVNGAAVNDPYKQSMANMNYYSNVSEVYNLTKGDYVTSLVSFSTGSYPSNNVIYGGVWYNGIVVMEIPQW